MIGFSVEMSQRIFPFLAIGSFFFDGFLTMRDYKRTRPFSSVLHGY